MTHIMYLQLHKPSPNAWVASPPVTPVTPHGLFGARGLFGVEDLDLLARGSPVSFLAIPSITSITSAISTGWFKSLSCN